MLRIDGRNQKFKSAAFAALALAFSSFGDAFLYPFLPLNFEKAGVSAMAVGLLLSINRVVRIFSNTLLVRAFARYGLRTVMILAVFAAIASTLGYGIASGLSLWILFRVLWGLAFSAMRIGTIGYALQYEGKGVGLGISRSLQEAGPMLTLFLAPSLLNDFDPHTIFYILALLSMPAMVFALALPKGDDRTQGIDRSKFIRWPSTLNLITLVSAILIDGIIVVVLGTLFLHYCESITLAEATTLAAFYLGYRRVCLVLLSPAGGWIADKVGLEFVFTLSMLIVVVGFIILVLGWIECGAVIVFAFHSINAAVTPGTASSGTTHALAAVAENVTWRDIGSAIGTLMGGMLVTLQYLNTIFTIAIFALVFLLIIHLSSFRKNFYLFYLWK